MLHSFRHSDVTIGNNLFVDKIISIEDGHDGSDDAHPILFKSRGLDVVVERLNKIVYKYREIYLYMDEIVGLEYMLRDFQEKFGYLAYSMHCIGSGSSHGMMSVFHRRARNPAIRCLQSPLLG